MTSKNQPFPPNLHMPTIGGPCSLLTGQAENDHQGYLDVLLQAELEEWEQEVIARRIRESYLPKIKTLEKFDFLEAQTLSATKIWELAEGGYIEWAEQAPDQ